jgi:hypothetical protein
MPIGWLVVLQSVPWTEVMKNAPKVAEGAKKLWSAIVTKKPPSPRVIPSAEQRTHLPNDQIIAALQGQVAALEIETIDLHNQMLASSELIKALAEQNTQLIQRVQTNRIHLLWLAGAVVVLGILVTLNLILLLVR